MLETAVVMWTGQIKSVLKTDPESVLTQKQASGEHPGPLEGLEFWASKAANLERIILGGSEVIATGVRGPHPG